MEQILVSAEMLEANPSSWARSWLSNLKDSVSSLFILAGLPATTLTEPSMSMIFPTQLEQRTAYSSLAEQRMQEMWFLLILLNSKVIPMVLVVRLKAGMLSMGVNLPSYFLPPFSS